ncbi:MAG: UPF0182 family protein [Nitrospirae bacterium]|nr:UPF0182 family protein [Nitrospirota bacterium]
MSIRALLLIALLLVVFVFGGAALSLYIDALWFQEIGYLSVFTTRVATQIELGAGVGAALFGWLALNVLWAARRRLTLLPPPWSVMLANRPIRPLLIGAALIVGVFQGLQAAAQWQEFLLFRHPTAFGQPDPLFGRDLGFYVFTLPFLSTIKGWLLLATGLAIVASGLLYIANQEIRLDPTRVIVAPTARRHLFGLGALAALVVGWGYRLDQYQLLYSQRGVAFGALYADVHARLPALQVLVVLAVAVALVLVFSATRRGWILPIAAAATLPVAGLVGGSVLPDLLHRFQVLPNEMVMERPYIEHNIRMTRFAYGLDHVEAKEFPASDRLSAQQVAANPLTTKNIRLWDHRPLLATYRQLQQIRTYYDFIDVDNDRYVIDGELRQVMISPRELSYKNLPSRIWINEHLTYTHGYGVTLGPVNRVSQEGLPEFFIKNIPPVSSTSIIVKRPEIYYGELPNDYVFVNTTAKEFDYPAGDTNEYATYTGEGGIPVKTFLHKAAFAASFGTMKILLSNDLTSESRIMINRNIQDRVAMLAPFLRYDQDPYLVITNEGRLVWIIDGYTTTTQLPYAFPVRGVGNYIRNSVKVTIDAYDGRMSAYISDPDDPIIRAYDAVFPGLFHPLDEMPDDLRAHLRYPQDLFTIQSHVFATYHMQDPQIFYNKEDLWNIPQKGERDMEPYYTIMKLPGEAREEFILMIPYTPAKRDNMAAWLAARADAPHYGKLIVYLFPKQKLVYGPRQIEARIDQDSAISQQLTLWTQRGSQAIRGSLLVIPIEDALLYVEPLYLAASESGALPELRRVIVAFGNQLLMEPDLETALARLFGARPPESRTTDAVATPSRAPEGTTAILSQSALEHYRKAQRFVREGNWEAYGSELRRLEQALEELAKRP